LGFGLGIVQYVPLVAYIGFWVMCIVSLGGRPLWGLYYLIPFIPYRSMRNHFINYPLGENMITILVLAVIFGALIRVKHLPRTKLYFIWLVFGVFLYFSMWMGTALGNAPAPLWLSNANFVTWKDYMFIPLVFVATGLVVEDRKAIRTVILLTAFALVFIDRSCIMESMSRTWTSFDEDKRNGGPLAFGSNQTAAFLAQFALFFWGFVQFARQWKFKLLGYALVSATIFAAMYTFSRGGYLAILFGVLVLGLLKDRKLLVVLAVFLFTWQAIVPAPVRERVTMTTDASGQLEKSAGERISLWQESWTLFKHSPVLGSGFATYQLMPHVDGLKDTHNWFVKVIVETGVFGLIPVFILLQQMLALSYRLFKRADDPLYCGLGLGLFLAVCCCIVANMFGDRWTYLEITGLLWVLFGAAARAMQLTNEERSEETYATYPRDTIAVHGRNVA